MNDQDTGVGSSLNLNILSGRAAMAINVKQPEQPSPPIRDK